MKDTNDNKRNNHHENGEEKVNFQSLGNICLLIIVVLILGNAILIYYMINSDEYMDAATNKIAENTVIDDTSQPDTIANILNTTVLNTTQSSSTTVDSTDVGNRKVMNENLVVLYDGLILDTTKMDQVELKYIDNNSQDKDKYIITYYNYENYSATNSTLGTLSEQVYDGLVKIENVGKIAISENYNAICNEIKIVNTLPTIILDNNSKLSEFDTVKVIISDLDSNGVEEYITILANKTTGYSKISLYDNTGSLVDDLAYIEKAKWNTTVANQEYYLSLDNVKVIDVDNDGVMEILVEIPKYEGEPSISILKYKNNKLEGKKNIECSLLP